MLDNSKCNTSVFRKPQNAYAANEPQPSYHYYFVASMPAPPVPQQQQNCQQQPLATIPPPALQVIHKPKHQPVQQFTWIASNGWQAPKKERGSILPCKVPHAAKQISMYMAIVRGFLVSPTNKQPGGSDNNSALPEHVIRVQTATWRTLSYMILHCDLTGSTGGIVARLASKIVVCTGHYVDILFDSLISRHSSHNWGRKFFLRFTLTDPSDPQNMCHDFVESAQFETITKRGVLKMQQKKAKKKPVHYIFHQQEQKQVVVPMPPRLPGIQQLAEELYNREHGHVQHYQHQTESLLILPPIQVLYKL